ELTPKRRRLEGRGADRQDESQRGGMPVSGTPKGNALVQLSGPAVAGVTSLAAERESRHGGRASLQRTAGAVETSTRQRCARPRFGSKIDLLVAAESRS